MRPYHCLVTSLLSGVMRGYKLISSFLCTRLEICHFSKEAWTHTHTCTNTALSLSLHPFLSLKPWWVLWSYYGRFPNLHHSLHSVPPLSITVIPSHTARNLVPIMYNVFTYMLNPRIFRKSFQSCSPTPLCKGSLLTAVKYLFKVLFVFSLRTKPSKYYVQMLLD